jgi:catechol 2,3-dioxygenase-like lactoylglutathione lyase family enzyme
MKQPHTLLSHIEINVSNYAKSIRFYDAVLLPLGWERLVCTRSFTAYCDGFLKLILSPVEEAYLEEGFHRKRIGLNHLALHVDSMEDVRDYYEHVMVPNEIPSLYQVGPDGDANYYCVLFEDPDRMKIEVVYAPGYCDKNCWPNNLANDFDPYESKNYKEE